jgi:hypothetical protein
MTSADVTIMNGRSMLATITQPFTGDLYLQNDDEM